MRLAMQTTALSTGYLALYKTAMHRAPCDSLPFLLLGRFFRSSAISRSPRASPAAFSRRNPPSAQIPGEGAGGEGEDDERKGSRGFHSAPLISRARPERERAERPCPLSRPPPLRIRSFRIYASAAGKREKERERERESAIIT